MVERLALRDACLKLAATHDGFERLIDALITAETGNALPLMPSGDERGIDAIGSTMAGARRAMKAKRYRRFEA